jgi:hypothetical protein
MAGDAIADGAKARKMYEKPLFENRWKGIVQVGDLRKSPEFLRDLRCFGRKPEEIWKDAETLADSTF